MFGRRKENLYAEVITILFSGVLRNFIPGGRGVFNKFSWGQRTENGDLGAVAS